MRGAVSQRTFRQEMVYPCAITGHHVGLVIRSPGVTNKSHLTGFVIAARDRITPFTRGAHLESFSCLLHTNLRGPSLTTPYTISTMPGEKYTPLNPGVLHPGFTNPGIWRNYTPRPVAGENTLQ